MFVVTYLFTCSFVAVARAESALAVVLSGVFLNVTVSASSSTTLERIFLLGGSFLVEGIRLRFGY